MSKRDALVYRDEFQWRADACAKAGLTIHAAVWTIAVEMCCAAAWTASFGALEAERLVRSRRGSD